MLCFQGSIRGIRESDEVPTGPRVCGDLSNHVGSLTEGTTDLFMTYLMLELINNIGSTLYYNVNYNRFCLIKEIKKKPTGYVLVFTV